ncbi:acyl carrier protein [Streptomyces sp. NPDC001858]
MLPAEREARVREIICEVLELDDSELTLDARFGDEYGADSMNAIEILSNIETGLGVEIERRELNRMVDLRTVLQVLETAKAR